jgi:hypothetical protein
METLLELSSKNSMVLDANNSTFTTVFGEPIPVLAGSTINFTNAFIDLGLESADLISIPYNLRLGINFYRYDEDIPKVPSVVGTDAPYYDKRYMYFPDDNENITTIGNFYAFLGQKTSKYDATLLPSFLLTRTAQTKANGTITDTFVAQEQTATIDIPAGFYSRTKFIQLVNDGFNLINGSFTNQDKPLFEDGTNPVTPIDYQLAPNNNSEILKAYEYRYTSASVKANEPEFGKDVYINDETWSDWFFPVYTVPTQFYSKQDYMPYIWFNDSQTGFLAGTTKFNLNYDAENNIYFIDYAHSPILDAQQREIVVFSRQKGQYQNETTGAFYNAETGYKGNGRAGGIMISRLFSLQLDDTFTPVSNSNTNFWQRYLGFGFDDAFQAQFNADKITETRKFVYADQAHPVPTIFGAIDYIITYPNPTYFKTATTNALIPIQWLQQSNWTNNANDKGFCIFTNDIPKTFQSIGSANILGVSGSQFVEPASHFLVELNIHNVKNSNYRDIQSYRQIAAVVGKTYPSTASYIQGFDDNTLTTLVMDEDTWIDKIEVRILNPDKTPVIELGENSTIFIKLTQPVVVQPP